jgi:ubiquinol-cytochrome c reductase cytochrome b subunit
MGIPSRIATRITAWLNDRLALDRLWEKLGKHPVPEEATSNGYGWLYVLGFVTLALFLLQIVTGVALVSRYIPSTAAAYQSVQAITQEGWSGPMIRGMHYWGASLMILFMVLHLARVFLTGAYKFPREANWITGVLLLVLVLAMGFTGQLLRWDQDGLWGVVVAAQYAGRVPLIGDAFQRFILGGDTVGGATLSRFFVLHVVIMPLLILALVGVHMGLVLYHGIAEKPREGEPVDPATYRETYQRRLRDTGRPYWPDAAWQELVAVGVVVAGIMALAAFAGPRPLGLPPDPAIVPTHPRPDWFLMWYYSLLAVKPRGWEDATMVYLPIVAFLALVALPLLRSTGERALSRRPGAVVVALTMALALGSLTVLGYRGPWVPDFETKPFTAQDLAGAPPEVVAGAQVFYTMGCQYCHVVADRGGPWGPDLTHVTHRMRPTTMTDRIIRGIGEMPAYRGRLSPEQLAALLAFLQAAPEIDRTAPERDGAPLEIEP